MKWPYPINYFHTNECIAQHGQHKKESLTLHHTMDTSEEIPILSKKRITGHMNNEECKIM